MPSTTELIKELREKTGAGIMECKKAIEDAMQVAAMNPGRISGDEPSADGAVGDVPLLDQQFIKDNSKTIQDLVTEGIAKLGENIVIRRISRFELGGG